VTQQKKNLNSSNLFHLKFRIGDMVKMYGKLVKTPQTCHIICYKKQLVENYNEITFHHLSVVKSHVHRTRENKKAKEVDNSDYMVDDDDDFEEPIPTLHQNIIKLFATQDEIHLNQILNKFGSHFEKEDILKALFSLYQDSKIYSPQEDIYKLQSHAP
jgi:F0F1-type ATP synthase gamma subunit